MATLTGEYQYLGRSAKISPTSGNYGYYVLLYAKTIPNAETATHTVSIRQVLACNIESSFYSYASAAIGNINGTQVFYDNTSRLPNKAWEITEDFTVGGNTYKIGTVVFEDSLDIDASDGLSRSVSLSTSWTCLSDSSANYIPQYGASGSVSVTATLAAIARASDIGASNADIGSTSTVVVDRKDDSFTHSIAYKFGSLSGYLTSAGGVSSTEVKFTKETIAFKVPTSFYEQIPDEPSGVCTLTCKTYSGSTLIGNPQTCTFVAKAEKEASKPIVSGTVTDINEKTVAVTGNDQYFVRFMSTAHCVISAQTRNGAGSIESRKIGGVEIGSETTRDIANFDADKVIFYAKDSRDYDNSYEAPLTLIPYNLLTNNSTGRRTSSTDGTAILNIEGNYYNGSFGYADNELTISYSIGDGDPVSVTPTIIGNTYSAAVELSGLDYQSSYTIHVVASDKLDTKTKDIPIFKAIPVFDWGEEDFAFNVPVYARKGIVADAEWIDLTLSEDFMVYDGNQVYQPQYKVFGNVITIRGAVSPIADMASTPEAVFASGVPTEYQPSNSVGFVCQGSGINRWLCTVHHNGNISVSRYGTTAVSNIPAGTWLPFCVTYQI